MIKMTVKYDDFDGNEVTEDLYFHLSRSELMDMALGDDDIVANLQAIASSGDPKRIIASFKDIIGKAYGVRTSSTRFTKSEDLTNEFLNSPAFDALLEILLTDADAAAKFVNGAVPKDLAEQIDATTGDLIVKDVEVRELVLAPFTDEQSGLKLPRDSQGQLLPWAFRRPTDKELTSMTHTQLLDAMRRQGSDWNPPEQIKSV